MAIHHVGLGFDFNKIHLAKPIPLQNGAYFTKINHTTTDEPLFVYTPRCVTKSGIVTSGTKTYMDLIFTTANTNFIEWVHSLEERMQTLMYEKRDVWFTEELELDDIQSVFMPMFKVSKGFYVMRVYLQQGKRIEPTPIFDENETPRTAADVLPGSNIIAILDIQGIKFCQKSFTVLVNVKQLMIVEHAPVFTQCLIKSAIVKDVDVDVGMIEGEPLILRRPEEVYSGIYRNAMEKGRRAQQESEDSFKMALKIKTDHGLELEDV